MNDQLLSIKAKKLGVRLSAFRQKRGIPLEALSQWTGISQDELYKIECGESTISLPEIELIALKMGLSTTELILGDVTDQKDIINENGINEQFTALRNRMIALTLRKTRTEQDKTLDEIATKSGISPEELADYESGAISIPWPFLEFICSLYQIPVSSLLSQTTFLEKKGDQKEKSSLTSDSIPDEISEFMRNPSNLPYLDLAKKLSELDAAKLRNIAEGLLEITY